jgi:hypothetical protein
LCFFLKENPWTKDDFTQTQKFQFFLGLIRNVKSKKKLLSHGLYVILFSIGGFWTFENIPGWLCFINCYNFGAGHERLSFEIGFANGSPRASIFAIQYPGNSSCSVNVTFILQRQQSLVFVVGWMAD